MADAMQPGEVPGIPSRYVLLGLLGQGGMGKVYRARDTQLDRDVAIKVIDKSELPKPGIERTASVERFVREARAAARLDHPNMSRSTTSIRKPAGW